MPTKTTIKPLPATSTSTLGATRTRKRAATSGPPATTGAPAAPAAPAKPAAPAAPAQSAAPAAPAKPAAPAAPEVPEVPAAPPQTEVLQRAEGIELIGRFEGSGFRKTPLIARRGDGQVVQLTEMLYAVAEAADGHRDLHEVARQVSDRCGRHVSADNVAFLAERKLRPLGVLALPDGTTPELTKREPFVALRHRRPLLSEKTVNAGARLLAWLHLPAVVAVLLLALIAFDVWLFGFHGVAGGLRRAIYEPLLLLGVFGSVVVATAFHEFGHASACRYGGARPGVMGAGLYLVWPAFYCDVTDSYRLGRGGRLRTDLGGVYFNGIFALLLGGLYFGTGEEVALFAAFIQHVLALQQLLPLLRFDGYYVLTDLTGVPDILSRIKPIFRSLIPGREPEPSVAELRPRVRFAVTAYLVTVIPLLVFLFAWMLMSAPRILSTVYDSLGLQVERLGDSPDPAAAAAGVLRIALLVLQVAAIALSVGRVARMAGRGLNGWSSGSAARRTVAAAIALTVIGGLAYIWWPNGDYEPIRPGERGTIGEAVSAIPAAAGGRPSFTPEQEQLYGPVPTALERYEAEGPGTRGEDGRDPASRDGRGAASENGREERGIEDDGSDAWDVGEDPDSTDGSSTTTSRETTTSPTTTNSTTTTDSTSAGSTSTSTSTPTDSTSSTSSEPTSTTTSTAPTETSTEPTPTTDTTTTPTTTDTTTTPAPTETTAAETTTAPTTTDTTTTPTTETTTTSTTPSG